jgi:membrane-associated phospholipid phosphatase
MRMQELIARDEALSARVAGSAATGWKHTFAWVLARSGDAVVWLVISGVLIWQQRPLGWSLLLATAVTAGLTAVAKGIFRRERPTEKWAIATDKYAFPSGHAARTGAIAVTLSFAMPVWTPLCLLWALLVSLSRVALSRHFLGDVTGGLLFGILVGLILELLVEV